MAHPITFILHDDSVNTYRFRMLTAGANLDEFRRNPVMFLHHNDYDLPIGRWENIRVEGSQILADAVFDELDDQAMKVKGKVDRGFIRMASIGAWAPEEKTEDPAMMLPGQTGPTVTKWTVREASIVAIGANHNALRMYNRSTGELIDLSDTDAVPRLMDDLPIKKNDNMSTLKTILNLQDNASDADIETAVQNLQQENESLKQTNATLEDENKRLKDEANNAEAQRQQAQKAEAVQLVDAAVRDGRLDASGKDAFIALFDADFERAKATLNAIPKVKSVVSQIEELQVELKDFVSKSWNELDRAGLLPKLKDAAPEIYAQKFKAEFGTEPNK